MLYTNLYLSYERIIIMAPFAIVAIVAASLFGTGTAVKEVNPAAGTAMQAAGVGALVGGGIGAAAGAGSAFATTIGTTTYAATVGTAAVGGAAVGALAGAAVPVPPRRP
jgi:hypothetical protein